MKIEPCNELDTISSLYRLKPDQFSDRLTAHLFGLGIICDEHKDSLIIDLITEAGYNEFNIMVGCFREYKNFTMDYFKLLKLEL